MIEPASILTVATNIGYPLIFLIVVIETGCGVPVAPGEIAVVTGGLAASAGRLNIVLVIVVAAAAAIVGDNIGYLIGKRGGRWILERPGLFERQRREVLGMGDWFFDRHGAQAVFIGRWLPILRVYASWMAGAARMPWRKFALWNAAGGIAWAASIALFAYFVGSSAKSAVEHFGVFGVIVVAIGVVAVVITVRRNRHRFGFEPQDAGAPPLARNAIAEPLATTPVAEPPS
jgi:membrane protein DedA with SNARE-associated domain